jgi:nucleoside-diphosphate-sugar epimerase
MIPINDLARLVMDIAGKPLSVRNIPGPTGVRGRNSDNALMRAKLGWVPTQSLRVGLERTYRWVHAQVAAHAGRPEKQISTPALRGRATAPTTA